MRVSSRPNSSLFGTLSTERFLLDVWQKKPLLIRQALPMPAPCVSLDELASLAASEAVETRLVSRSNGRWRLKSGPLDRLPRARRDWTLLVQGANLYLPVLDQLLQRFAFLPYTRLDDVMVSYAVAGGGVGPHFDSYDVFLLQASGRRRWRISTQRDLELVPELPLKILQNFVPEQEWILEPGDMLYLPPHIAHEGVALDACTTYSIGFRAPEFIALGREFLFDLAERLELPGRYEDAGRDVTRHPAALDDHLLEALALQLSRIRWTRTDVVDFVGSYFSEPKETVYFTTPRAPSLKRFIGQAQKLGLAVDPKTRLLYRGQRGYINGESFAFPAQPRSWLEGFADERRVTPEACSVLSDHRELATQLHDWFCAGWITKGAPLP